MPAVDASIPDAIATEPPAAQPMTLFVCTTCRREADAADQPRAGARLHAALAEAAADPLVRIVPVECLSVCRRTCAVGFAAPGKWTYVYGDLAPDDPAVILEGARLFAAAPDGLIPWKVRPAALKKGAVARTPPLEQAVP